MRTRGRSGRLDPRRGHPGASALEDALRLIDASRAGRPTVSAVALGCRDAVRAPVRIVEIGSFRGRSTIVLASAAHPGVELVAIDPHAGSDRGPQEIGADAQRGDADHAAFESNLRRARVCDRVRHVRRFSQDALAEVAGAQRYRPVRQDIELWGGRVGTGGTMLIDDTFNAIGVTLAHLRLLLSAPAAIRGASGRWLAIGVLASTRGRGCAMRCLRSVVCRTLCGALRLWR